MIKTTSTGDALTGSLSGTGHDMVRATVHTGTIPSHPPTDLADAIHPVYDDRGDLQDWRFGSLLPDHHLDGDTLSRFRAWRAGFAQDRLLGERALIRSFLDWLGQKSDTSALGVLRLPSGHVDFHTALRMKVQIEAADRVVSAAHEDGLGLYAAGNTRSAMRVLIPPTSPTLLLGLNEASLTIGVAGLSLLVSATQPVLHPLNGWRVSDDSVTAVVDGRDVPVPESDAAKLLQVAGRQAAHIDVHDAPLHTLLAPVLVFLRDVTALAGSTGGDLHFRSGLA